MQEALWILVGTCSANKKIARWCLRDLIIPRIQGRPFHKDPCRLWDSPLTVGRSARHAKDMIAVEKHDLTQARASAVRQTTVPAVTAADQVSIVLEPDEGE